MKRKAAENKPDGTRIPENQKKCYCCKANGHITRKSPEKTTNKNGNAFFVGMCDNKEEEEQEEDKDIGYCPNCGGEGMVGLECEDCKDSGLVYENEHGQYEWPEVSPGQATTRTIKPTILELPLMMELCKEKDKLKEREKRTGFEYGWCIECNTIGPLYIMCMKCHGQGQSLTSTRKIHKNEEQEVHQLGNEEQSISEWLINSGASIHVANQEMHGSGGSKTNNSSCHDQKQKFNGSKVDWRTKDNIVRQGRKHAQVGAHPFHPKLQEENNKSVQVT